MDKKRHFSRPIDTHALHQDSWRVFQIMAEFVEGFERLSNIAPSVSIFGSARFHPEHPFYLLAERIAYELSEAGFSVVSGGGPGIMEAANRGAREAGGAFGLGLEVVTEPGTSVVNDGIGSTNDRSCKFPCQVAGVDRMVGSVVKARRPSRQFLATMVSRPGS